RGRRPFQCLRMTGIVADATIGIQDSSRTAGLLVAFDQTYVRDSLAVRIAPLRQWLSVEPASGFLRPGERQTVALRFDAAGLGSGSYARRAQVLSHDPG